MMIDTPPWNIISVVPPDIVKEDPKHYKFQFQGEFINESICITRAREYNSPYHDIIHNNKQKYKIKIF